MGFQTSGGSFDHDTVWVQVCLGVGQAEGTVAIYVLVTVNCNAKEQVGAPRGCKRLRQKVTHHSLKCKFHWSHDPAQCQWGQWEDVHEPRERINVEHKWMEFSGNHKVTFRY